MSQETSTEERARSYYDSDDADNFYFHVWGGEDIHVGIYERPDEPIREASRRTVERMSEVLGEVGSDERVLDIGAGYGGSARYLAARFGCHVCCLNLSAVQNKRNEQLTAEQDLSDKITVTTGTFDELPYDQESFDIVWSQDAILHSSQRRLVLQEVFRVLRPGGRFIFTDPMQADEVPSGVLQPVYDRIHLDSLGSVAFYRQAANEIGFVAPQYVDLSQQLPRHYARVLDELERRTEELESRCSPDYVGRMKQGLRHWIDAGQAGHLRWGVLAFRKP